MHHHNHRNLAMAITILGTLAPREASAMSPCGGVQVSALPITTLTWDTINGQPSYRLQIAANANFQWPDLTEVSLDGFYFQIGLQFGTHYYWRLSAGDGVNWGPYGAACDFFTTAGSTAPTGTPNQYSPTDGQAGLGGGAYVSWSSVGAAATYALQYATNASFTGATNLPLTVTATSLSGLASGQTYYWRVRGENGFGGGPWSTTRTFYTTTVATTISSKVFLQGPLVVGTTTLMSDGLRAGGWLPSGEPYSAMGYTLLDNSGASISSAVLATTGNNAPVDWILLEARNGNAPQTVVRRWALLVQRDGDIMMPNGSVPSLEFPMNPVRLGIRHRNHLGICAAGNTAVNGTPITMDFTNAFVSLYGTNATTPVGTALRALWAGDCSGDGTVKYTGAGNDRDRILTVVGGTTPNSTVIGYRLDDVNLDGVTKYTGTSNDRDPVLTTVGSTTPNTVRVQQFP